MAYKINSTLGEVMQYIHPIANETMIYGTIIKSKTYTISKKSSGKYQVRVNMDAGRGSNFDTFGEAMSVLDNLKVKLL